MPLTAQERRFVAAVRKNPPEDLDETDQEMVEIGRAFCGTGTGEDDGGPPTVELIAQNKLYLGPREKYAVLYLCPKYIPVWKRGMSAFEEGEHVVGEDIKPGRYKTAKRKVKECYWERTTKGGDTIANGFVNFAPAGVTVTILPSDGGFTSTRCGLWVPA